MPQRNQNQPASSPVRPRTNGSAQLYLAALAAGWVFVVGMAVGGPWAVGTRVENRLVIAPALVEKQTELAHQLERHLENALARALWAASAEDAADQAPPWHWQIRWERLSLTQQRELMQQLGLSFPPSHFLARWRSDKKRSELVVCMVHADPGSAPARLQHLLHQAGNQAVARAKHKLSQKLAAVRAQARQHWQALIQADSRLRQWLLEVLGPQATVTPVAYWRQIPAETEEAAGSPILQAAADPEEIASGKETPPPPEDAHWARLSIQQLRRRVAELEAQDQELAARLTELHPQRQQVRETLRRLRVYLARRLKEAGKRLSTTPARAVLAQQQNETQAQQQVVQLLQQHAQQLRQFQQELENLSRAYLETAREENRLWQQYQQFERIRPLHIAPPQFAPVWLTSRRNFLALLLAAAGLTVAVGLSSWQRWSQDTFTSPEQMRHELNHVVTAPGWWYEASFPPRKRWRLRLQRLQRLLEGSLLALAVLWAALAAWQESFRHQWVQDPLLAIACWWRFFPGG